MNFGLTDATIKKMQGVFEKYAEIEKVILYGSRAKNNYREGSDIDLTLVGQQISNETRSNISLDLDDLNMPYLIDLSLFNELTSPHLLEHINRVGKIFYQKTPKHNTIS